MTTPNDTTAAAERLAKMPPEWWRNVENAESAINKAIEGMSGTDADGGKFQNCLVGALDAIRRVMIEVKK